MKDHPRVGVAAIILRNNQVLLIRRKNVHGSGTWSTPGGHLELGETPEQCAIRETREEVGFEIEEVRFVAATNDLFAESGKHYITLWMTGACGSGEPGINAAYEVAEFGWFHWEALPGPLFLPFDNLLKRRCYPPEGVDTLQNKQPRLPSTASSGGEPGKGA